MTDTRDFPTSAILSISTGILFCKFAEMHEAAEYLMGHPIWTHHFASKELWRQMQRMVLDQCPEMPTAIPGADKDNYLANLAKVERLIGSTVTIRKGDGSTEISPLDGILQDKPVIVIADVSHD